MKNNTQPPVGSFAPYVWPLVVFALLLGHVFLMLVAVTLANADPPRLVEGAPYSGAPKATASETP